MKKKRILNRARKESRAVQGTSPSSSPSQGEETDGGIVEGEETEGGHPRRVPIDPIPFKTWKIKKLPPDLKAELDRMFTEGTLHSCRQLAKWLGDNGFEISHAAIHKYGQKFERRLDAIRLATEQARIVCERFKDDDDEQMHGALMRMVQTRLFEVLGSANEREKGARGRGRDDRAGEYHGAGAERVGIGAGGDGASEVGGEGAGGSRGGGEKDRGGAGQGAESGCGGSDSGGVVGD